MANSEKDLLQRNIIFPAVIAVVMTAAVCIALPQLSDKFPFSGEQVTLAQYEEEDLKKTGDTPLTDSFEGVEKNTVVGTAVVSGTDFPLVYNADEVNEAGKLNISENSVVFGNVGCTFLRCKKSDAQAVKSLKKGSTVKIESENGNFEYKIVKTVTAENENELNTAADGIGKAVALYTDNSSGVGIGNEYFVAVGQLTE
ncbi:MAG: hypothetical protein ACI4IQ_03550 [Eubacterium sp.]